MKVIGTIAAAALCLLAASPWASGQVAQQTLSFGLIAYYGTNFYGTNLTTQTVDQALRVEPILISSADIVNAIALDLAGKGWTNWYGSRLIRNTDLITGAQGIFLRKGNLQTNVTSFFGGSFANDFTGNLEENLSGFTNTVYYDNGVLYGFTNAAYRGSYTTVGSGPTKTNSLGSIRLISVSLNTSNLKFNLLACGTTAETNLVFSYKGTNFNQWVNTILATGGVGNFDINLGTNIFFGHNLYETTNFVSGPATGSIVLGGANFSILPGP